MVLSGSGPGQYIKGLRANVEHCMDASVVLSGSGPGHRCLLSPGTSLFIYSLVAIVSLL